MECDVHTDMAPVFPVASGTVLGGEPPEAPPSPTPDATATTVIDASAPAPASRWYNSRSRTQGTPGIFIATAGYRFVFVYRRGCLSFGPIEKCLMVFVMLVCTRRTGAAARVEQRRRER